MAYGSTTRVTTKKESENLDKHLRLDNPLRTDRKPVKIGEDSTGLLLGDKNVYVEGDLVVSGSATGIFPSKFSLTQHYYFSNTTTSRTYFRDVDDSNYPMKWDAFDTDDSTTLGTEISIAAPNSVSGIVVPYDCHYAGANIVGYQGNSSENIIYFQTWTGSVVHLTASTVDVTLRTTDTLTSSRDTINVTTADPNISLNAGDSVYAAFQYVSGISGIWSGNITYKFTMRD